MCASILNESGEQKENKRYRGEKKGEERRAGRKQGRRGGVERKASFLDEPSKLA